MEFHMAKRRMREKDAIILSGILGLAVLLLASPLWAPMIWKSMGTQSAEVVSNSAVKIKEKKNEKKEETPVHLPLIDETGTTLGTRINPPTGYQRVEAQTGSLGDFLRNYKIKKSSGVVKLWDGTEKENLDTVQAVLKLPMEKEDLQRSAGAVIRLYAEYYFSQKAYDKIKFQFANGFLAEYIKWQEGFRIRTDATGSIWVNGGEYDVSKKNLQEFMHVVLTYTSADTMEKESKKIKKTEIQIGDVFLQTGQESDVAMVVDVCENEQGQKAFLLAKGGKPAQQFHLLKNPAHKEDPWYYVEEMNYPLNTGEFSFEKGTLRRLNY